METFRSLTPAERAKLVASVDALEPMRGAIRKYDVVRDTPVKKGRLDAGCIIFSQYLIRSGGSLTNSLKTCLKRSSASMRAGHDRAYWWGAFSRKARDELKQMVRRGESRLLLETDSASEGLNLQRLSTLMNLDLPWNPTRLEQLKVAFNVSVTFATELSITCGIKTLLRIECTSYSRPAVRDLQTLRSAS